MRYALVTLAALGFFGCKEEKNEPGAFVCASRIECPNQRDAAPLDECNDAAFDPSCGALYRTYFECFSRNNVCDGRGQFDVDASVARCAEPFDKWRACVGGDTGAPADTALEDTFVEPDTTETDTSIEDTTTDDTAPAD